MTASLCIPYRPLAVIVTTATLLVTSARSFSNDLLQATGQRTADSARSVTDEARARLAEAASRAIQENRRLIQEASVAPDLAKRAATAQPPQPSAEEQARLQAGETRLSGTLANLSPEGRAAVSQAVQTAAPANQEFVLIAQAAQASGGLTTPPPAGSGSSGPQPQPLKPTPLENPAVKAAKTVITCTGASFFDANKAIGIFTENVRVYHPTFYLECDELEVFMKKADKPKGNTSGAPTAEPGATLTSNARNGAAPVQGNKTDEEDEASPEESSIDKVIARGAMVVIEKFTENGDIQVGKCKNLTYDGNTQVVTLRVWPQVQRGPQLQIADDASTVMTISPEGAFKSIGRSRTEILQGDAAKIKTKGLRRAPEQ